MSISYLHSRRGDDRHDLLRSSVLHMWTRIITSCRMQMFLQYASFDNKPHVNNIPSVMVIGCLAQAGSSEHHPGPPRTLWERISTSPHTHCQMHGHTTIMTPPRKKNALQTIRTHVEKTEGEVEISYDYKANNPSRHTCPSTGF